MVDNQIYLPTPPRTVDVESNLAFLVAKSWLLLSEAGAITAAWLSNSSLPRCKQKRERKKNGYHNEIFQRLMLLMRQNAWQMPADKQVSNNLIMEWNFRYVYKLHTDAFHVCFFKFPNVINIFRWNLMLHSISG